MMIVRRLARPLLAATFVSDGVNALRQPGPLVACAEQLKLPQPQTVAKVDGGALVAGGLALATGRLPRLAAVVLAAASLPVMLTEQAFWEERDAAARATKRTGFLKGLALFGGLLLAAVDLEGRESAARQVRRGAKRTAEQLSHATSHAAEATKRAIPVG
ncbi:MAG: DoxX family protein [Mycobacteriales bacterium]